MTQHDRHFSAFKPHTLLKHQILDSYIVAWAMKLLIGSQFRTRLAIVDAFAGAGRDDTGKPGSPIIAAQRAKQAMTQVNAKRETSRARIDVYAIEQDPAILRKLQDTVEGVDSINPELVHLLGGTLADHIDAIMAEIGDAPAFFFFDPYGVKGLDASTYRKALRGPHNEIFALFSDLGAVRLHATLSSRSGDPTDRIAAILASPTLFEDYDAARIATVEADAATAQAALDVTTPVAREYLTRALGDDSWQNELEGASPDERADRFIALFNGALTQAGAHHITPISMRNDQGHRVYALVHSSKSPVAVVTMKQEISTGLDHSILSDIARDRMKADLSVDVPSFTNNLARMLAGHTARWAEDGGLRWQLLAYTPLFPFQAEELKTALRGAGILQRVDRRDVCVFPALLDDSNVDNSAL
jgi:three-Cys-motif partner protein